SLQRLLLSFGCPLFVTKIQPDRIFLADAYIKSFFRMLAVRKILRYFPLLCTSILPFFTCSTVKYFNSLTRIPVTAIVSIHRASWDFPSALAAFTIRLYSCQVSSFSSCRKRFFCVFIRLIFSSQYPQNVKN